MQTSGAAAVAAVKMKDATNAAIQRIAVPVLIGYAVHVRDMHMLCSFDVVHVGNARLLRHGFAFVWIAAPLR
jgi:hypothetical protein